MKKIIKNKTCLVFTVVAVVLFVLVNVSWWANANASEKLVNETNDSEFNWIDGQCVEGDKYFYNFKPSFLKIDKDSLRSESGFLCSQHNAGCRFYDKNSNQMSIYDLGLEWDEEKNELQFTYRTQCGDYQNQDKGFRFSVHCHYIDKDTGRDNSIACESAYTKTLIKEEQEKEIPYAIGFADKSIKYVKDSASDFWYLDSSDDDYAKDYYAFDFDKTIKEGSYAKVSIINYLKLKIFGEKEYKKYTISDAIEKGLLYFRLTYIEAKDIDVNK